jgi:hypothetical protein
MFQQSGDGGRGRDTVRAVEAPCLAEYAGCDIEFASAQSITLIGIVQQSRRLRVDADGLAGTAIDFGGFAVFAVATVFLLDTQRLRADQVSQRLGEVGVVAVDENLAWAGHAGKGAAPMAG